MDYAPSPWDNFTTIVADTLGIQSTCIDPSTNFQEIGGTSLNIVSAVLKLQESGFSVTVEQFMEAGSMEKLFLAATAKNGHTDTGYQFSLKPLEQVDALAAQKLLAGSFLYKSELFSKCGGMEMDDFLSVYRQIWATCIPYSFAVVDEENELRAVALAADHYDLLQNPLDSTTHTHFVAVSDMLQRVTLSIRTKLNPTEGKRAILYKFMFGASLRNTAEDNVTAFSLIERELINTAGKNEFHYTIAENISPLTQQLSQYLGCKRYATVQLNQWKSGDGSQPFANCTDDFTLTVDVYETGH